MPYPPNPDKPNYSQKFAGELSFNEKQILEALRRSETGELSAPQLLCQLREAPAGLRRAIRLLTERGLIRQSHPAQECGRILYRLTPLGQSLR